MSAYWISLYREVRDEQKLAAYAELAGPALTGAGGTFIARGMPERTYEAGVAARCVEDADCQDGGLAPSGLAQGPHEGAVRLR